jgi:chromosome segregation ATPase
MAPYGSGEWVEHYIVPAGPWHRIMGLVRGGLWPEFVQARTAERQASDANIESLRAQVAELQADLERNERSYQAVVQRADRLAAERNAMREVVEAARHSHEIGQVSAALCAALAQLDKGEGAGSDDE